MVLCILVGIIMFDLFRHLIVWRLVLVFRNISRFRFYMN